MSAEIEKVYIAYCEECDWESEQFESLTDAEYSALGHDESYHE